jgi:DeoR/GlpR family transcriptional regulator of sugar metabolism
MLPAQRRQLILDMLGHRQQLSVDELANELNASRETIRRDLAVLDTAHKLRRVHGGAVPLKMGVEDAIQRRRNQHRAEKERIATRAAELFEPGDSLFVDAGTTTEALGRALGENRSLTVITNSVEVATRVWSVRSENHVHLLGGHYNGEASETHGPETVRQVGQFYADHAVLTIGTVDETAGFMDFSVDEAAVAVAMIDHARSLTVLADHSKLARTALVQVCALGRAARLVTGIRPPENLYRALIAAGVEVMVVDEMPLARPRGSLFTAAGRSRAR